MKHLYFVRHGLSEMNEAGLLAGRHSHSPLTRRGKAQAVAAGEHARALNISHIVSSPIERAHHTGRIIAQEIGYPERHIEIHDLLKERDFGALEGQPWSPNMQLDDMLDVETIDSLHERAQQLYHLLCLLPGDSVLVVSHGAMGRALRHTVHRLHPATTSDDKSQFQYAQIAQLI